MFPGQGRIGLRGWQRSVLPLEALPLKLHQALLLGIRQGPRRLLQLLLPPLPVVGPLSLLAQFPSLVGLQPAFFLWRELGPIELLGLPDLFHHLLLGLIPQFPVLLDACGRRLGCTLSRGQGKHCRGQSGRPPRPDPLIQWPS